MTGQLSLFSDDPPAPAPAPVRAVRTPAPDPEPLFPTPATLDWARKLTAAGITLETTEVMLSKLWTRVVSESLSLRTDGRFLLRADGTVDSIAPDTGAFGRLVFASIDGARAIHAVRRLVPVMCGTHAITYRFARPGEATSADLPMPFAAAPPAKQEAA